MANFDAGVVATAPTVGVRLYLDQGTQNAGGNWTDVSWTTQYYMGAGSRSGTWDYNTYVDGVQVANSSFGGTKSGTNTIASGSYRVYHDANGNKSVGGSAYLDAFYGTGTASGSINLSRLPLAPPITSLTIDTIKATAVRIGIEIGGYGHGTSAAMYPQYRLQGSGTWISVAAQNDAAGYNYFTITGLTQGKIYEYRGIAYNNNGDQSETGVQTFKTKVATNLLASLIS